MKNLECDHCTQHFSILYDFGNAKLCHNCLNMFVKEEQVGYNEDEEYNEEEVMKPIISYKIVDDAIELYMAHDNWDDFVKEMTRSYNVTEEQAMLLWQAFDVAESNWVLEGDEE